MSEKNVETFKVFSKRIGDYLNQSLDNKKLDEAIVSAYQHNGWFTKENVHEALQGIHYMLEENKIDQWLEPYNSSAEEKKVGIIMAGNLPLVGFHDLLCVLMAGHSAMIKMSSDDKILLPTIVEILSEIDPEIGKRIDFVDRLKDFDAVIATGSNNTSRYFEYYFRDVPHIIRKNRNSMAVLTGDESEEDLKKLGDDIFKYYGLGCRSVSKVLIPENYNLDNIFGAIQGFHEVSYNKKYANNYDYYKAFYILNKDELIENGFLLMKKDPSLFSPVAMLFYDYYRNETDVKKLLSDEKDNIQCIVSQANFIENPVAFGRSQTPELWDYADGVDTMEFLSKL